MNKKTDKKTPAPKPGKEISAKRLEEVNGGLLPSLNIAVVGGSWLPRDARIGREW